MFSGQYCSIPIHCYCDLIQRLSWSSAINELTCLSGIYERKGLYQPVEGFCTGIVAEQAMAGHPHVAGTIFVNALASILCLLCFDWSLAQ